MVEYDAKEDSVAVAELRRRLAEAEESLQAIRKGEVDAFVINTPTGDQIYTLQGTDTIYRKILEEMAEGAITLSDNNIILYCNASFANLVSAPIESVIGTNFFDYVSPLHLERVNTMVSKVTNGDGAVTGEFRLISLAGKETPVQASAKSIPIGGPKTTYFIVTDLTEKEALAKKTSENERFSAIGKVTAMVAHDLRGPLNVVSQATEMMEASPDKAPRMLKLIRENTSRAITILGDLRENTRELELSKIDTDVDALVRKTLQAMLLPQTISTKIISPGPTVVALDPDKMRRVFSNIINNAVEAMPNGGTLSVAVRDSPGRVEIEIADTGEGIPDSVVDRIFELFVSTKSNGTGLGLAICKRMVEAQGGEITFKTEKGKGTSFAIALPRARTDHY